MKPPREFEGDVVAITGAGAGLGREYAIHLATRGASVVINDIDECTAEATATLLHKLGGQAVVVPGSVTDSTVCEGIVSTAIATFGKLDALINNAGIAVAGRLTQMTDDDIRCAVDVHLLGTVWTTRAALRVMEERGQGRVVITTAGSGAFGLPRTAIYSAANAALIGLTRALALDAADTAIRINGIAPIADSALADDFFRRFQHLDRGRYTPAAVAPIVGYLAHRDCALQGAVLTAGGGRIARVSAVTAAGHFDHNPELAEIVRKLDRIVSVDHPIEPRSALDEFLMIEV